MAITKLQRVNANGSFDEYSGKATSAGAGDAFEFPILDSAGKISPSMMPNGVGADSVSATAAEAISAGDFVYFNAAGAILKADATTPAKAAKGYVLAAILNAAVGIVFFDESNSAVAGLTPNSDYFLSNTAGGITLTPTTVAGQISQFVGFATSATNLHVNIGRPITRNT